MATFSSAASPSPTPCTRPIVTHFRTYKIDLEREADSYCETMTALPAMQEWTAAAKNEPMIIDQSWLAKTEARGEG